MNGNRSLARFAGGADRGGHAAATAPGADAAGLEAVAPILGESPAILELLIQMRRFAVCDMPVLITGESGTGKELIARAIHQHSRRPSGPYVALHCGAVPAGLIAAELFGCENGSNAAANLPAPGHVERANGGTLVLDEIGDLPTDLQGLLLHFLQAGEIRRIGGRSPVALDVRVVVTTHLRPHDVIAAGRLRADLYHRLNMLNLHLPPLREREGDIVLLAGHFLRRIGQELGRDVGGFTPSALTAMRAHRWPGNVRELMAVVRRAVMLAGGPLVEYRDLGLDPAPAWLPRAAARRTRRRGLTRPKPASDAERDAILQALNDSSFNMTRAAQLLGVARATLYRMLARNRIELGQHYRVHAPEQKPD